VITVAPQNDICPHGKTYPINAVAIGVFCRNKQFEKQVHLVGFTIGIQKQQRRH
jgi:hypothetical protein